MYINSLGQNYESSISSFQQLRHENLVNLLEVFRRKRRLYLVFEFVDHTVLDDLERCPSGLDEESVRRVLWQVLKGIEFCHVHNVSHTTTLSHYILNKRLLFYNQNPFCIMKDMTLQLTKVNFCGVKRLN